MTGPETQMGSTELDVFHVGLDAERHVRVRDGQLQGIEGTAVRTLTGQRVCVELQRGVFLEVDAACLETVD